MSHFEGREDVEGVVGNCPKPVDFTVIIVADRSLTVTYLSFCHLTYILIIFCGFMMVVL